MLIKFIFLYHCSRNTTENTTTIIPAIKPNVTSIDTVTKNVTIQTA